MSDDHEYLEDLALRMQRGEPQAFIEFSLRYGPIFYRYFHYDLSIPDADARELSASTVTDLALRVHKYTRRDDGSFNAWVYQGMRNAGMSWLREHWFHEIPIDEAFGGRFDAVIELDAESAAAVSEAVASLDPLDRFVVEARCRGSIPLGFKDIAADWNANNGAVVKGDALRVRYFRALEKLETILRADPRVAGRVARMETVIEITQS